MMQLDEFVRQVDRFDAFPTREKCQVLGWFLHTHKKMEHFGAKDIGACYHQLNLKTPNVSQALQRMTSERKPPDLIKQRGGYKLERTLRLALDAKYSSNPSFITVSKILSELPEKIPNLAEKSFFIEALLCYRISAFRSCIVMVWNLAYSHLLDWILVDQRRLDDFNSAISKRYPKLLNIKITKYDSFIDELKESQVVEICNTAGLINSSTYKILKSKLEKRNMAAHPANTVIVQSQADDVVTDLVNNVVLSLG